LRNICLKFINIWQHLLNICLKFTKICQKFTKIRAKFTKIRQKFTKIFNFYITFAQNYSTFDLKFINICVPLLNIWMVNNGETAPVSTITLSFCKCGILHFPKIWQKKTTIYQDFPGKLWDNCVASTCELIMVILFLHGMGSRNSTKPVCKSIWIYLRRKRSEIDDDGIAHHWTFACSYSGEILYVL
jgi:hypothetical protein